MYIMIYDWYSVSFFQLVKRQTQDDLPTPSKPAPKQGGVKKPRMPKKKKKKDPNEPQKYVNFVKIHFYDNLMNLIGQF